MDNLPSAGAAQTIVGLFDDDIAAEHVLAALRKSEKPAGTVSVLARDKEASGEGNTSQLDVTRAVMDTALSAVSGWLLGLAALMVPRQGSFLAAGPIGAVLAEADASGSRSDAQPVATAERADAGGSVGMVFERFGFHADEAFYLEQRLAAGSVLIAVTAQENDQVESTLRTFGDNEAVFIGQATTPDDVLDVARTLLTNPLSASSTEVIVADVVSPLLRASTLDEERCPPLRRCGGELVDLDGEHFAEIDDLLIEIADANVVRYVIAGHGGVLGIARKRYAIPVEVIALEREPVQVLLPKHRLADVPLFDGSVPFSRKDELAVHQSTGTKPSWYE